MNNVESNAGEQLVSELTSSVHKLLPAVDVQKIKSELSVVVSRYHVRPLVFDESQVDIDDKIKIYLSTMRVEGLAKDTLYNYELDLRIFARDVRKNVIDITPPDIRAHLATFEHLKKSSLETKLSRIKSFFAWLTLEEIISKDPTKKVKPPKKEHRLPRALTVEELEMMREACKTPRERAMVEVLYATGCRVSEIVAMDINAIDIARSSVRVIGKGNKEREVYFSFKSNFHMKRYRESRKDDCPALFVTLRRPYRRLQSKSFQRDIKKIALKAGISKNVTPHIMRHTFATLTLGNGASLSAVQEMLGHSDPATTQIYARLTDDKKREQHKQFLVQ